MNSKLIKWLEISGLAFLSTYYFLHTFKIDDSLQ